MAVAVRRRIQTAYEESRWDPSIESVYERIETAMFRYLVEDLGLPESDGRARAQRELSGAIGLNVCNELAKMGIAISGKRVLDLGAGMGGLSTELVRRGAIVVGLEPGAGWCQIAADRVRSAGAGDVISAVGEAIPLASESIDVIVSHQVLEHVQNPRQVIEEAFRVLKPGGHFYFAYANYFSFREQHYRVFWLPLLPKVLGAAYLRLRGRNPQFLMESVTYTTFYSVRRVMAKLGFECLRRAKSMRLLNSPDMTSLKWRVLKQLAIMNESATLDLICAVDYGKRCMSNAIYECMRKPSDSQKNRRSLAG
jgi:2-polyprenyl-3-methyl-5-hydroxy-6-metoxy-1,4-benzoquinol methylase